MTKNENLTAWVIELIDNFLARSPLNNLQNQGKDPAWEEVLVGFASGADPLFQEFKEYIGPFTTMKATAAACARWVCPVNPASR